MINHCPFRQHVLAGARAGGPQQPNGCTNADTVGTSGLLAGGGHSRISSPLQTGFFRVGETFRVTPGFDTGTSSDDVASRAPFFYLLKD